MAIITGQTQTTARNFSRANTQQAVSSNNATDSVSISTPALAANSNHRLGELWLGTAQAPPRQSFAPSDQAEDRRDQAEWVKGGHKVMDGTAEATSAGGKLISGVRALKVPLAGVGAAAGLTTAVHDMQDDSSAKKLEGGLSTAKIAGEVGETGATLAGKTAAQVAETGLKFVPIVGAAADFTSGMNDMAEGYTWAGRLKVGGAYLQGVGGAMMCTGFGSGPGLVVGLVGDAVSWSGEGVKFLSK